MKTNIKMYFVGDNDISRKTKKNIKKEIRNCVLDIYRGKKSIKNLIKITVSEEGNSFPNNKTTIYSEVEITEELINRLFPKKISKKSNYLLGNIHCDKKNVLYLIDVDELFFESGEYKIWPNQDKKNVYVKIH